MQKIKTVEEARRKRDIKLRQLRGRQNRILALIILGFSLLIILSLYIYNSSFWEIGQIEISGNKHCSKKEIISLAAIKPKTSLMKLPKRDLEARLMKHPWLKEVFLYRRLPRTLLILVKERTPFVVLKKGKNLYLLDEEAYVIEKRSELGSISLPVVRDSKTRPRVGHFLKTKSLKEIFLTLKSLDSEVKSLISWVSFPAENKITFYMKDNLEIIWGSAKDLAKKNFVVKKILKTTKEKIIYINVTAPNNPVVRKLEAN